MRKPKPSDDHSFPRNRGNFLLFFKGLLTVKYLEYAFLLIKLQVIKITRDFWVLKLSKFIDSKSSSTRILTWLSHKNVDFFRFTLLLTYYITTVIYVNMYLTPTLKTRKFLWSYFSYGIFFWICVIFWVVFICKYTLCFLVSNYLYLIMFKIAESYVGCFRNMDFLQVKMKPKPYDDHPLPRNRGKCFSLVIQGLTNC